MSAPEFEDGLKSSEQNKTFLKEHETNRRLEKNEERRKCNVGNYWGFSLEGIFALALKFFKEMNGKAFNPTYEENLLFVALQKQIFLGPYNPKFCTEVGFFDVLGNDRRKKWVELGSMAKEDAMEEFVKLLHSRCSRFSPYVISHKIEKEEHDSRLRDKEKYLSLQSEEQHQENEEQCCKKENRKEKADHLLNKRQSIMVTLNALTPVQLQKNAEGQPQKHYPGCIMEAHHTHQIKQQDTAEVPSPDSKAMASITTPVNHSEASLRKKSDVNTNQCHLFIKTKPGEVPLMAPSMWMTPDIHEFKAKLQQDAEAMITVGRGEVVTVHIPTHHNGSTFFWEFATDYYDIAFGLDFEWPVNSMRNKKFLKTESENQKTGQIETAIHKSEKKTGDIFSRVSEVVPLFRRDSHENIYAGSHQYPGQGVYLLRFDNSYSLWRSKVVYYRVYYSS